MSLNETNNTSKINNDININNQEHNSQFNSTEIIIVDNKNNLNNNKIGERLLKSSRKVGYVVVSGKPEPIGDTHTLRFCFSASANKGDINELSVDLDRVDIIQELPRRKRCRQATSRVQRTR